MNEVDRLKRRIERERAARHEAEAIAERGLRKLFDANTALDQRVAERTAELSEARERLLVAQSTRQLILANLSHELRTPLHAVIASLGLLADDEDDAEARAMFVKTATEGAQQLDRLVGQLFDLVEIDGNSLVTARTGVNLADLIHRVVARWHAQALSQSQLLLPFATAGLPEVIGDAERLDQVLDELVGDAVNNAGPGTIRCSAEATDAATVKCVVSDARVAAAAPMHSANLKTARGLIEAMGGTLEVVASECGGTLAAIELSEFSADVLAA